MLKSLLITILITGAGFLGASDKAEIIAVKFHADWCGSCKAMGDSFTELQAKFDSQPVLYVTLDNTREHLRQQAAWMTTQLGLGDVLKDHHGTSGFVLLIDSDSKKVLAKLTREHDLKAMGSALVEAVKTATSG